MKVEMRCPLGHRRLLAKMLVSGQKPHINTENLVELACSDCARDLRKQGIPTSRVLHRYDILGNFVETVTDD